MLDAEYKYFSDNIKSLYKQYGHKFLIIKGQNVLGAYDTFDEALKAALKTWEIGTFLVQECFEDIGKTAHHFQGNVSFDLLHGAR